MPLFPIAVSKNYIPPRTQRASDGTISIDNVLSQGVMIPYFANGSDITAGSVVVARLGSGTRANPLSVSDITAVRAQGIGARNEVGGIGQGTGYVIGVAVADHEEGTPGLAASFGSVVVAKCDDASVDTGLATPGGWVIASPTGDGTVASATYADILTGIYDGLVVGRILVAAGTNTTTRTGSLTSVLVLVQPQ